MPTYKAHCVRDSDGFKQNHVFRSLTAIKMRLYAAIIVSILVIAFKFNVIHSKIRFHLLKLTFVRRLKLMLLKQRKTEMEFIDSEPEEKVKTVKIQLYEKMII